LKIVDPKEHIRKTWNWDDEKDWFQAFSGGQVRVPFQTFEAALLERALAPKQSGSSASSVLH
jgi:hypothetical protein